MKYIMILSLLFLKTDLLYSQNIADAILNKAHQKLNNLKNFQYHISRELNYASENYHHISSWSAYYDFESTDTIIGFKYQIENAALKQVFNGTEKFDVDKKMMTIQINDLPELESFNSISAFYNSLITLKNILPLIINDTSAIKTVSDTTINNNLHTLVTVNIGKRRIQNLGKDFDAMSTKSNFIYKIILNPDSNLPVEVLQTNDINDDFIKTSFTNIEPNTSILLEHSWYFSSYNNTYKPLKEKTTPQLLKNNTVAPEWKLKMFNEDKMLSLADLKGNVILLDFWIKNCGACIQSVPYINSLQHKFKSKAFKIISINAYDAVEDIAMFSIKHNINFPVLLNGKEIAGKYGLNGFPAFFLIDKKGKIIYSNEGYSTSMHAELENIISKAL